MYPEDRVLVGVMPDPRDFEIAQGQQWYRVPAANAPTGIHAEYVAFYFTKKFPEGLRWGIHYYARRTGHELMSRAQLLPAEADHPRAQMQYYKLQLGPLRERQPPILSLRWRRVTFIQTTWDRFIKAREINDLFSTERIFVDRVYHALKMRGVQPEREVQIKANGGTFNVDLLIPCRDGAVMFSAAEARPAQVHPLSGDVQADMQTISEEIKRRGGPLMVDLPF